MHHNVYKQRDTPEEKTADEEPTAATVHHSHEDLQNGKWLTDEHICLAQRLLRA